MCCDRSAGKRLHICWAGREWTCKNIPQCQRNSSAASQSSQEWAVCVYQARFLASFCSLAVAGRFRLPRDPYIVGWIVLIGVGFCLHFGFFHILSLFWRTCGRDAVPIMDWPIASRSLSEFWGRRWNRAFRDLTHRFVFLPLLRYVGLRGALLTGFLASGLIHDVVISLPAGGGFGGPTTFFAIQAIGILLERSHFGRSAGLGRGLPGRIFCAAFLVLPVGLLFHRPFVCNIIVPFVDAIRSLL